MSQEQLEHILGRLPATEAGKPAAPKEALKKVLRQSRRPFSARIFRELAERVSLQAEERAFAKLRCTLQAWFGAGETR